KEKNSNYKIAYVTSEKFTNELINSIKEKNNEEFRKKYRSLDVLLIDDIQFIEGKEATQEEFFHTFNELHSNNKQIIISSDRPPQELITLEDRLRSRFESGVPIDIQAPDFETRVAILKKKCEIDQRDISDDVLILIAKNIKSNIRELEGSLNKVWSYSKIMQTPITYDMATEVLKDMLKNKETKELTIDYIKQVVAKEFNIKIDDLSSKARPKNIAYPRQIAMYIARELTDLSLPKIGEEFGGRDHTTVMHACDKIKDDIEKKTDKIDIKIDKIIAILKD
ncbi:MAG: chromosomal replication initiator protein DnaA, partial [Peptoanaerobacter stomatis]